MFRFEIPERPQTGRDGLKWVAGGGWRQEFKNKLVHVWEWVCRNAFVLSLVYCTSESFNPSPLTAPFQVKSQIALSSIRFYPCTHISSDTTTIITTNPNPNVRQAFM